MFDRNGQRYAGSNQQGRLTVGGGLAALLSAGLAAGWAVQRMRRPPGSMVGAHAWVVPVGQAQREAQWTRQAMVHSSESKG